MLTLAWSSIGVIINIIMYAVMMLLMIPYYFKPDTDNKSRNVIIFTIFFLFCLFPLYSPDTFAYYTYYLSIKEGNNFGVPLEQIYFDIISGTDSFLLFRLIVWGGACACVWITLKSLKIRVGAFLLFFIGLFILKYSYARAFLSFALVFLGMALFYMGKRTLMSKIIGLCIIISASIFHKSALFGVSIALLTILIPTLNKNIVKLLLVIYPLLIILAEILISNFFDIGFEEGDLAQNAAQYYLKADTRELGIGKMIENILTRYSFYAAAYLYIAMVFKGSFNQLPLKIRKFATAGFLIVYLSSIFIFNLGYNTQVYYYRLLHFSIIPISVFLGYLYQIRYRFGFVKTTWKIGFVGCLYSFLYTLYNSFLVN